ncbi:MAG: hypothetical protein MUC97_14850 [Bernardetiaceae bacterium]|jgi:hypothetical protein|nr:hypothetical protein [Bernardetiaceae bacterium]
MAKTKPSPAPVAKKNLLSEAFTLPNAWLWGATALVAVVYFAYSSASDGFYQQDEAAHFLSMRGFWYAPNSVLSNWAKPGYKLLYALPALGGSGVVTLVNCLVAALAAWLAYKIAEQLGSKLPGLAFAAAALQPLWVNLSFRNYSEIVSATLLAWAVWLQLRQRPAGAALVISYITFIRQEFYPIAGLYFLYLAWQKKWLPALLLAVFPLLQNAWGGLLEKDWLYLPHQILTSSDQIGGAFPRKGFEHYFLMSITIFGSVVTTLALAYLLARALEKVKKVADTAQDRAAYWLVVPSVIYFAMYVVFNTQALNLGPSGGGNLRYLLIISPLLAGLAGLGVEKYHASANKGPLLGGLAVWALLVAIFMTYQNNLVVFTPERDWLPLVGVLLTLGLLVLPLSSAHTTYGLAALLAFLALVTVRPIKLSAEDRACRLWAAWYAELEQQSGERPLYLHHDMFFYFLGRTRYEFKTRPQAITDANAKAAPKGSLFFWDSHYSYRPELRKESLQYEYFTAKPNEYKVTQEIISDDQTFGVIVFEKQ